MLIERRYFPDKPHRLLAGLSGMNRQGQSLEGRLQQLRKSQLPVLLVLFKVDLRRTSRDCFKRALSKLVTLPLLKLVITSHDKSVGNSGPMGELCLVCHT